MVFILSFILHPLPQWFSNSLGRGTLLGGQNSRGTLVRGVNYFMLENIEMHPHEDQHFQILQGYRLRALLQGLHFYPCEKHPLAEGLSEKSTSICRPAARLDRSPYKNGIISVTIGIRELLYMTTFVDNIVTYRHVHLKL